MGNPDFLSIVVLISGSGSNLQAIIDAINFYSLPIKIESVISSNEKAYGLERAQKANLPHIILSPQNFADRTEYDHALANYISQFGKPLITLAGFMHILGNHFLESFPRQIINIHPSLLPLYPGLNTHSLAIKEGIFDHGCTVHFVNENLDAGPIIAQASVKVKAEDTETTLKQRVHRAEHFLYPTVLNWFANQRIKLINDQVYIDNIPLVKSGLRFALNSQ